jgi:hypothetical protein
MAAAFERIGRLETDTEAMMTWRRTVEANTVATKEATEAALYVADVIRDLRTTMRSFAWVMKIVKWLAYVSAAIATTWATFKGLKIL